MSSITGKSSPRDAQVMAAILKDMGVADYEPRVINQMLEFSYRYVTDILDDAKVYSTHSNKKNVDAEDVRLAIQCKLDHSFTQPPPRDLLMDIARHKNNNALPLIKPYTGIKLPPDRYCLSQANYRLRPHHKKTQSQLVAVQGTSILPTINPRLQTAGIIKTPISGTLGGSSLTLVSRAQPSVSIRPATATAHSSGAAPLPIIRLNTGGMSTPTVAGGATIVKLESLKRKREEDDDYDML